MTIYTKEALEEAKAKAQAEIEAKREQFAIRHEIQKINAKVAIAEAQFANEMKAANSAKLAEIELACSEIVASLPIYNRTTKEDRKWNPSQQFGLGTQVNAVAKILTGIQYSAADHKTQMLEYTGLNEDLVEATVEAFGSQAYYNEKYNEVVEERAYNTEILRNNLALVAEILEVEIDLSKVNEQTMKQRFDLARLRANTRKAESDLALEIGGETSDDKIIVGE